MQTLKSKKPCPYCKEKKVIKQGSYYRKKKPFWIRLYVCKNCKRYFNEFKLHRIKEHKSPRPVTWKYTTFMEVKKLINKKGYFPSKMDRRKDKTFLSSRAIIEIVDKKRGNINPLHSSLVCKLIKKYRIEV